MPVTLGLLGSDGEVHPSTLQDATPFTLRGATPATVIDAVLERVLETGLGDWAALADLAGAVDADAIAREEDRRSVGTAVAVRHPGGDFASGGKFVSFVHGVWISLL